MKIKKILGCFICLFFFQTAASAQNEWMRVVSDNGEFSIEVPSNSAYFFDYEGFMAAKDWKSIEVKEMRMVRAFREKTMIVVESYRAGKDALEIIRDKEARNVKSTEIKADGYKITQVVQQTPEFYAVRKFFASKEFIYVLTAASRDGETPAMKRFFDSLAFKPDKQVPETTPKAVAFSKLKQTKIEIDEDADSRKLNEQPKLPNIVDQITKLAIISKPSPSFTSAAKRSSETGTIRLRITFTKDGMISKIAVLKSLEKGLLQQAVSAAMRIKFLPQERDGEPETVSKLLEYGFNIY